MPSPSTVTWANRIPNGGFNRAAAPQAAGEGNWFDLLNLRPLPGQLVQTPPIVSKANMSLLAGEGAVSRVHFIDVVRDASNTLQYLVVNESNARYVLPSNLSGSQTKLPCVLLTSVPNNTTVNGYAVLSGYNTTDFSSDGDTITVQITGTSAFRWKKNSGGFTSVSITAQNMAIGSNGLVISFFATSGFTVNDTWVWTRSALLPYSISVTSTKDFAYSRAVFQTDVYLGGIGRNIMRVRDGLITSVGYNRIYGKYVDVFQNHLVVAHFAQGLYDAVNGVQDSYDAKITPFKLGWSDLNNPDGFVPFDGGSNVNAEMGTYVLPYNTYPDAVNYGITGMAQLYNSEYIYLPDAIYQMQYVGLPQVMQTLPRFQGVGCYYPGSLVLAKRGHYFLARDNIYFFNGLIPTPVGEPVRTKLFQELSAIGTSYFDQVFGYYDTNNQEVIWTYWTLLSGTTYQCRQCIYQEKYSRFFFRNVPTGSTASPTNDILAMCRVYGDYGVSPRLVYGTGAAILYDFNGSENIANVVADNVNVGNASTMTQPTAESNDLFYGGAVFKKEGRQLFLDAGWDTTNSSNDMKLQPFANGRNFLSSPASYTTLPVWNSGNPEQGMVPISNVQGRFMRYKMQFQGTTPVGATLNAWSDGVYGMGRDITT